MAHAAALLGKGVPSSSWILSVEDISACWRRLFSLCVSVEGGYVLWEKGGERGESVYKCEGKVCVCVCICERDEDGSVLAFLRITYQHNHTQLVQS